MGVDLALVLESHRLLVLIVCAEVERGEHAEEASEDPHARRVLRVFADGADEVDDARLCQRTDALLEEIVVEYETPEVGFVAGGRGREGGRDGNGGEGEKVEGVDDGERKKREKERNRKRNERKGDGCKRGSDRRRADGLHVVVVDVEYFSPEEL